MGLPQLTYDDTVSVHGTNDVALAADIGPMGLTGLAGTTTFCTSAGMAKSVSEAPEAYEEAATIRLLDPGTLSVPLKRTLARCGWRWTEGHPAFS